MTSDNEGVSICGGYSKGGGDSECFHLPYNNNVWLRSPNIPMMQGQRRVFARSAWINDQWWVTGGFQRSTEVRGQDKNWNMSVTLPDDAGNSYHCMISLDQNRVLFIGGLISGSSSNATYLYDKRNNSWQRKKSLLGRSKTSIYVIGYDIKYICVVSFTSP